MVNPTQDLQPLLGRSWLDILYPDWCQMFVHKESQLRGSMELQSVQGESSFLCELKLKFGSAFVKNTTDFIKEFEAEILLKDDSVPIFHKAYNVPYKIRPQVEEELERLCKDGILSIQ